MLIFAVLVSEYVDKETFCTRGKILSKHVWFLVAFHWVFKFFHLTGRWRSCWLIA